MRFSDREIEQIKIKLSMCKTEEEKNKLVYQWVKQDKISPNQMGELCSISISRGTT